MRFKATLQGGRFHGIEALNGGEPGAGFASWFIPNVIRRIRSIDKRTILDSTFELRLCNLSCDGQFPVGYSVWRIAE